MKEKLESDEPSSEPRDQKVTQSRLWLRQRHLRAKEEEKCMMVRMARDVDFQFQLLPQDPGSPPEDRSDEPRMHRMTRGLRMLTSLK